MVCAGVPSEEFFIDFYCSFTRVRVSIHAWVLNKDSHDTTSLLSEGSL
jgi:hypothetical protein